MKQLNWKTYPGGAGTIVYNSVSERLGSAGIIKYTIGQISQEDGWRVSVRYGIGILHKRFDTLNDAVDFCELLDETYPNWDKEIYERKHIKLTKLILEKDLKTKKLIEFPEFRQAYVYDCGASAFQCILAFFGIDEREEVLLDKLDVSEDDGTSIDNIKRVAKEEYEIETKELKDLTIDSLKKLLDKDVPVLMLIQAWPDEEKKDIDEWEDEWEEGHYVIAVGYTDKEIIFEDPSMVVRTYIPFNELDKRWHDVDVTPKGKEKILDHWGMIFSKDTDYKYDPMNAVKMD